MTDVSIEEKFRQHMELVAVQLKDLIENFNWMQANMALLPESPYAAKVNEAVTAIEALLLGVKTGVRQ